MLDVDACSDSHALHNQLSFYPADLGQQHVDSTTSCCPGGLYQALCLLNIFGRLSLHAMSSSSQRRFQYNLRNALEVRENTGPWTVVVQVLVKYPTKSSQNNPNMLFKKFLLTDMQGTAISAITFDAVDHFDRLFQPFKRYYVTSANVRVANPKYKVGDYNYTWTLYPRTHVQPLDDPSPYICPYSFDFIRFSDMFRVAERDVSVAVKGLIVHDIPVPNTNKPFVRDYVLVDDEKRPTILRVWADVFNEDESGITAKLPQPTFIDGLDLKETTHNGLSLTTGFNAHFMVNPPLRENGPLLAWYNDHIEEVNQLVESEAYKSTDCLLPPPLENDIVPIKDVSDNMATLKTAWVSGIVLLMPAQNKLWHTVCDKCKKTVTLPVGSDLPCMYCKKEMNVEARCHVHVYLNDESGTISATLFSKTAEEFIGHTAMELVAADEKHAPLTDQIAQNIDKAEVMCFLKDDPRSHESRFERIFPDVKLYVKEVANAEAIETVAMLGADTPAETLESCAPGDTEKEKQLFSPSTKGVVDDIAVEVGVDEGLSLSNAAVKRGIVFNDSATEGEAVLLGVENLTPAHEVSTSAAGSVSPIKKLKNAPAHN